MTVDGSIDLSAQANGNGGSFNLSSSADLTIGSGTSCVGCVSGSIKAEGGTSSGNGGSIFLSASNLTINSNSAISVVPRGTGNGGLLGLQGATVTLATNTLNADALGSGNGGYISLSGDVYTPPGPITITANGAGSSGKGGYISLAAGNFMNSTGAINLRANASGTGDGGTIYLYSNQSVSPGNFLISATGGSDGSSAGKGGNFYSYGSGGLIDFSVIDLRPLGVNGDGGKVTVYSSPVASDINVSGVGTGNGGTIILYNTSTSGLLKAEGGLNGGNGGTISISAPNDLTIPDSSKLSVHAYNGNGGNLSFFSYYGSLHFSPGIYEVNGNGKDHSGGQITFTAQQFVVDGSGSTLLSANGSGAGNGGTIALNGSYLSSSGTGPNAGLDLSASNITLSATGGSAGSLSGNGGIITGLKYKTLVKKSTSTLNNPRDAEK